MPQIHLWGSGLPSNMAHRQVTSFMTDEAVGLMDEGGGVDAAVIHPPSWDPSSTELAFKAVRECSGRFAILGAFPLSSPDRQALVETWRESPGMLGLRYGFLQDPMRGWLADGTLDGWGCRRARRRADRDAGDGLAAEIGRRRAPSGPPVDDRSPGRAGWQHHPQRRRGDGAHAGALGLARHPNVAVKATGAPGDRSGPYPYTSMHRYLRQIYDAFGPARMFWGTDISKMPCSWRQCVTMFTEELPWLPERDKASRHGPGRLRLVGLEEPVDGHGGLRR